MSAMQLATNKRLRWPADNVTFSGGNACELTKFLLPLVANRSLPVRRSSNGVLLQIDDGPGYTLALVTSEIKRSEEHTSELQSRGHLVCRLLLEKKKNKKKKHT